ncbi:PhnD/SsuA/transferrin family substrate-binding protein [Magnetovibrio sp. PR-2]|uniref:substrate-binding domain-containing protein n=1 Tax=Magnetovibrio sp. PR-2 TaxID=3120356 RepID=UPI002FCDEE57
MSINGQQGPLNRLSRRQCLTGGAAFAATAMMGGPSVLAHHPYKFGLTPVFLDSNLEIMAAMTKYFTGKLQHPVTPVMRRTYQEITSLLLSGGLQAAWICGFPYVQYRERLKLLAMPLYKGEPLYQSYLIVNKNNPAAYIEDLADQVHAFSDPNSNSGYLVTLHLLAQKKKNPSDFFSQSIFTYSHRNVIRAVSSGLAQSGSVDGYVWDVVAKYEPELVAGTRVIRKSEPLGFPPIACSVDSMDDNMADELAEALFLMSSDALGREVLNTLHLDGFVPGDSQNYDAIADKMDAVRDYL